MIRDPTRGMFPLDRLHYLLRQTPHRIEEERGGPAWFGVRINTMSTQEDPQDEAFVRMLGYEYGHATWLYVLQYFPVFNPAWAEGVPVGMRIRT